jgi:hypothetical protein
VAEDVWGVTTLPTWVVVLLGLASPFVAVVAIVVGGLRERSRQDHERKMQRAELEGQRIAKQREERLKAYATFARLTKKVDAENPSPAPALAEAHSEIEMLSDNPELVTAATVLLQTWGTAWEHARKALEGGTANPYRTTEFMTLRDQLDDQRTAFIRLAQDEFKPS